MWKKINLDKFDTWTWRKLSNSGILLNFNAFCTKIWKKDHILRLLNRAKITSSSDYLFPKKNAYLKNLFTVTVIQSLLLTNFYTNFKTKKQTVKPKKNILIFFIPYLGKISKEFGLQIQSLIKKRFDTEITIVYKTTKVQEYFSLKSKTPLILNSNVVYKFTYSRDVNVTYIGMFARHLRR